MLTPRQFQEHILPYLYDLLEPDERRAFESTLEASAEARASLESAKGKQLLLAKAVKEEFPEVTFKPPTGHGTRSVPATFPYKAERPRRHWARWVLAASLLLAVLTGASILGISGWTARQNEMNRAMEKYQQADLAARDLGEQAAAETRLAQADITKLRDQIKFLDKEWKKEIDVQKQAMSRKNVQVNIIANRTIQAGANNTVVVDVDNKKPGEPLPELNARVIDSSNGKVYFNKTLEAKLGQNNYNFDLPRDLPVVPGNNLAFEVVSEGAKDAPQAVRELLTLAAPEYVTHLFTDRPMYRPGEIIHFRSLTLERFSLKPARETLRLLFRISGPNDVEIFKDEGAARLVSGPKQAPLKGPDGQPLTGIGAGDFRIPADLPGGQYILHVTEGSGRFPPEKRSFLINQWQAPRFNKEITFNRASYGPGDSIEVSVLAVPAEGGAPANPLRATMAVTVDGQQIWRDHRDLGPDGRATYPPITLPGPQQMPQGNGVVSIVISDGATNETVVRPIPIVLGKLFVDFYPEGGDLIAGLPNRVYFQARTSTGKPADVQGRIVDQAGALVAKALTLTDDKEPGVNQGMGVFEFTPLANSKYELKIDSPTGMHGQDGTQHYFLPAGKEGGVVLRLPQGVVDNTIEVEVTSADKDRHLLVGAYCRGKLLDHVNLDAKAGMSMSASLKPSISAGGVYRITVFEKRNDQFIPLAERLIFRKAVEKLNLAALSDKQVYVPGDKVRLALEASNEKKELTPSVLMVAVVDLSVHKLANDKTERAMPTHFLLTSEVRQPADLENADFFLGQHPKATQALDLLLGTQGWRRFAEQDPARFQQKQPDAERILHAGGPAGLQTNNPEKEVLAKVDARFNPQALELEKQLAEKEKVQAGTPATLARIQQEQINMANAQNRISAASAQLESYQRLVSQVALGTLVLGTLLSGLVLLYIGMRRLSRGRSAVGFFTIGAAILGFVFLGSLVGTVLLINHHGLEDFNVALVGGANVPMHAEANMVVKKEMAPLANEFAAQDMDMAVNAPAPAGGMWKEARRNKDDALGLDALQMKRLDEEGRVGGANKNKEGRFGVNKGLEGINQDRAALALVPPIFDAPMQQVDGLKGARALGGRLQGDRFNLEVKLRQQGKYQQIVNNRQRRLVNVPTGAEPFIIREYAHKHQFQPGGVRSDFTETLYWHPALVLADGKAAVSFDLSDAATRFQVLVFGHTAEGRLGAATYEITSRLPVSLEPMVPIEVTSSDVISIPVAVANDQKTSVPVTLEVQAKNLTLIPDAAQLDPSKIAMQLEGNTRQRRLFHFSPAVKEGQAVVRFSGDFGPLGKDAVERTFKIVPEGFPVMAAHSGLLEKTATHEFTLPESWVPGTLQCQVQVFPSTLADLQKGLEGLLREPGGCFEQSSTSNYPNVLILNYLKEADLSKPDVEKRARQLLTSGYGKLTSFECLDPKVASKREGYEWFGQTAPPHEALTAYGLLQFKDMAKVYAVDEDMLRRTQKYLLDQRDGMGGFKRNPRSLDSFGRAPDHITNAYIVWALTESGLEEDLSKELDTLYEKAKDSTDPYFVALVGISHVNQNKAKLGVELLKNLDKYQKNDGRLEGAQTSITGSGGRDLIIETTALATLGWLKANRPDEFNANVNKAIKWLSAQRGGYGGFGSTQSTILALKALIAHTRANKKPIEPGMLSVYVGEGGAPVAGKNFAANVQEPITISVPEQMLERGPNTIRLQITGKNEFPYTISWSYQTLKPANAEKCPVQITAGLNKVDIKEGATVGLKATIENKTGKGQGMTVAIIGLPGGLALPADFAQLKAMTALRDEGTKPGLISAWELRGRELVLYWRDLAPDAKIEVNLDLIARLPGIYRGPAPRAYLYYNSDDKFWTDPLAITIHPVGE